MAKKTDEELIELYARRLSEARRRKAEAVRRAAERRARDIAAAADRMTVGAFDRLCREAHASPDAPLAEVLLEAREGRGADGPEAPAECPPGPPRPRGGRARRPPRAGGSVATATLRTALRGVDTPRGPRAAALWRRAGELTDELSRRTS